MFLDVKERRGQQQTGNESNRDKGAVSKPTKAIRASSLDHLHHWDPNNIRRAIGKILNPRLTE